MGNKQGTSQNANETAIETNYSSNVKSFYDFIVKTPSIIGTMLAHMTVQEYAAVVGVLNKFYGCKWINFVIPDYQLLPGMYSTGGSYYSQWYSISYINNYMLNLPNPQIGSRQGSLIPNNIPVPTAKANNQIRNDILWPGNNALKYVTVKINTTAADLTNWYKVSPLVRLQFGIYFNPQTGKMQLPKTNSGSYQFMLEAVKMVSSNKMYTVSFGISSLSNDYFCTIDFFSAMEPYQPFISMANWLALLEMQNGVPYALTAAELGTLNSNTTVDDLVALVPNAQGRLIMASLLNVNLISSPLVTSTSISGWFNGTVNWTTLQGAPETFLQTYYANNPGSPLTLIKAAFESFGFTWSARLWYNMGLLSLYSGDMSLFATLGTYTGNPITVPMTYMALNSLYMAYGQDITSSTAEIIRFSSISGLSEFSISAGPFMQNAVNGFWKSFPNLNSAQYQSFTMTLPVLNAMGPMNTVLYGPMIYNYCIGTAGNVPALLSNKTAVSDMISGLKNQFWYRFAAEQIAVNVGNIPAIQEAMKGNFKPYSIIISNYWSPNSLLVQFLTIAESTSAESKVTLTLPDDCPKIYDYAFSCMSKSELTTLFSGDPSIIGTEQLANYFQASIRRYFMDQEFYGSGVDLRRSSTLGIFGNPRNNPTIEDYCSGAYGSTLQTAMAKYMPNYLTVYNSQYLSNGSSTVTPIYGVNAKTQFATGAGSFNKAIDMDTDNLGIPIPINVTRYFMEQNVSVTSDGTYSGVIAIWGRPAKIDTVALRSLTENDQLRALALACLRDPTAVAFGKGFSGTFYFYDALIDIGQLQAAVKLSAFPYIFQGNNIGQFLTPEYLGIMSICSAGANQTVNDGFGQNGTQANYHAGPFFAKVNRMAPSTGIPPNFLSGISNSNVGTMNLGLVLYSGTNFTGTGTLLYPGQIPDWQVLINAQSVVVMPGFTMIIIFGNIGFLVKNFYVSGARYSSGTSQNTYSMQYGQVCGRIPNFASYLSLITGHSNVTPAAITAIECVFTVSVNFTTNRIAAMSPVQAANLPSSLVFNPNPANGNIMPANSAGYSISDFSSLINNLAYYATNVPNSSEISALSGYVPPGLLGPLKGESPAN